MNEYYKHEIFKYAIKMAMEHGQEVRLEDSNIDHDYKTMGALVNNQTKEQTLTLLTMIPTPVIDEDQEESDEE